MERLTFNDLNKVAYDPWELCGMDKHCTKCCHEDGGCAKGCHILKMYRKLAEYEDMEEQGRLVKLPCKVGDMVYEPRSDRDFISEYEIKMITIASRIRFKWTAKTGIYGNLDGFYINDIGSTIFLTREEAEQKLKEMQNI